jgi:hypothetical protein
MTLDETLDLFYTYALFLGIPPVLIGLLCWNRMNRALRYFWFAVLTTFVFMVTAEWLRLKHINNEFLSPIGTALDTIWMTLFFRELNRKGLIYRLAPWACALVLSLIVGLIWFNGISFEGSRTVSTVQSLLIELAALITLQRQFRQSVQVSLRHDPAVWILVGLAIMNALTVIINIFGTFLYNHSGPLFNRFWDVAAPVALLIYYGFTCVGFWQTRHEQSYAS